jgi:hypothetical protein
MDWEGKTTVMVRNIPNLYTQKTLLSEVCRRGFAGSYDFFYLPMDFNKNSNAGYAFANFVDVEAVAKFREEFDNKRLDLAPGSTKFIQVVPATLQGYEANYQHFAHSAVFNHHRQEHAPVFVKEGKILSTSKASRPGLIRRLPGKRTLVVSGVPIQYTHAMLFMELCVYGCGQLVEVLHLPEEGEQHCGTGYIVLHAEETSQQCVQALDGKPFSLSPGAGPMRVERLSARRARTDGRCVVATPTRTRTFEYAVKETPSSVSLLPSPAEPEPLSTPGAVDWESFCAPHLPFSPEIVAAYASALFEQPPATPLPAAQPDALLKTLRELREDLDPRFAGLDIAVDEDAGCEEATPYAAAAVLDCCTPLAKDSCTSAASLGVTPTVAWSDAAKMQLPRTPRKVSDCSEGSRSRKITPPTTTAGSSQNSTPDRTPREVNSLSPELNPADYNPFDLPSIFTNPMELFEPRTPPRAPATWL